MKPTDSNEYWVLILLILLLSSPVWLPILLYWPIIQPELADDWREFVSMWSDYLR